MQGTQSPGASAGNAVDFQSYIDVFRRRWLFIATSVAFLTGIAGAYSFSRAPVFTASAEVVVLPSSSAQGYRPDQLVSLDTEARLAASAPVADIAKEMMRTSLSVQELLEHVSVETAPETLVLDISFWAASPASAAAGANAFAEGYLEYKRQKAQDALLERRRGLQELINESTRERDEQNAILEDAISGSAEARNATAQRDTLNGQIALLTAQLAEITVTVDPGEVILPATVPDVASSPNHTVDLALGIFLGGFLGLLGAFVVDRVDDRIRTRADLEAYVGAPVLAVIPRVRGWHRRLPGWLVTEREPGSPGAEAYRTLRTSVMAMGRHRETKVIAVVGATLGEGKTSTTANLASALAHADNRVVAVSADLRKPRLHEFFGLKNDPGLSDLLAGVARASEVAQQHESNLVVISGGTIPDRPAELLESEAMRSVVGTLREQFDMVIIDTPPVLGLADTLAVAPLVDAVLLVAHAGTSRGAMLQQAVGQLEQIGAKVRGCVLTNVVIGRNSGYQYGYGSSPATERYRVRPASSLLSSLSSVRRWVRALRETPSSKSAHPGSAGAASAPESEWKAEQIMADHGQPSDSAASGPDVASGNGAVADGDRSEPVPRRAVPHQAAKRRRPPRRHG